MKTLHHPPFTRAAHRARALGLLGVIVGGLASSAACSGLDTGNGDVGTVEVALELAPGDPVDEAGATFALQSVTANIKHIEIYSPRGPVVRLVGPWSVDLLSGVATPPLPPIEDVPAGTLRRVDVRFGSGADDITLAATGTTMVDGAATPFDLALRFEEDARFDGSVRIPADAVADVFLRLDPTSWFSDLPLTECAEKGDLTIEGGRLILGEGRGACAGIEKAIKDAIEASARLEGGE